MKHLFIFFFLFIVKTTLAQSYVFHGTWEDGDRSAGGKLNQNFPGLCCTNWCMQVTSYQARLGNNSIESIVNSDDPDCGGSTRCESLVSRRDSSIKNMYYAASIYPVGFTPDQRNGLCMQWYVTGAYPVLGLWIKADPTNTYNYLQIIRQFDTANAVGLTAKNYVTILDTLPSDRWTDLAFEINWQNNYTGYIKVYINGRLYTTINGANMKAQFDPEHPRWPTYRFGWYWFGAHHKKTPLSQKRILFDEVKVGNSDMTIDSFLLPPLVYR